MSAKPNMSLSYLPTNENGKRNIPIDIKNTKDGSNVHRIIEKYFYYGDY